MSEQPWSIGDNVIQFYFQVEYYCEKRALVRQATEQKVFNLRINLNAYMRILLRALLQERAHRAHRAATEPTERSQEPLFLLKN
jgi:hypothetical protein